MKVLTVKKRFELHGLDGPDLERRIDTLRRAIQARRGTILDIQRSARRTSPPVAAVLYELPLSAEETDAA